MTKKLVLLFVFILKLIKINGNEIFSIENTIENENDEVFCYNQTSENGPSNWNKFSTYCNGSNQSPINIISDSVIIRKGHLRFSGVNKNPLSVTYKNVGHTIRLTFDWKDHLPHVSGGPLHGIFNFEQLHYHFGNNETWGSEHQVNGKSFPMEIHLVFCNMKYKNFHEAIKHSDGLAVVGRFFKIVPNSQMISYKFADILKFIKKPGDTNTLKHPQNFTIQDIIKSINWDFYSYGGSLTTPPCSEAVNWIISQEPILITLNDMKKFWNLIGNEGMMSNNCRPIQQNNNRKVHLFKKYI